MHSQQPLGVVQNWSTLQCSKQNTEQCGYDHAPVTRGRMRAQFPLPHGPKKSPETSFRVVTACWPLTSASNTGSVREHPTSHSQYRGAYHTIPSHAPLTSPLLESGSKVGGSWCMALCYPPPPPPRQCFH